MEDYKVHSSWTFHEICHRCMDRCRCFNPRGLSNGGSDFVMLDTNGKISKYNVEGEFLQHFQYFHEQIRHSYLSQISVAWVLPEDLFSQEVKQRKRINCSV
ncbi:hypothetical protein PIB30_091767 [Stylosanthes scabra]|uniref:Uncharacterized protein n=1 Tax=Stylosanthes scabra TaxID=79078 RepID=A0ABU6QVB2_9FABA|nr:hypothetical protein [Stylosanthes scabra]